MTSAAATCCISAIHERWKIYEVVEQKWGATGKVPHYVNIGSQALCVPGNCFISESKREHGANNCRVVTSVIVIC